MSISARIVLDSINSETGDRLTSFAIRTPRFLLPELLTHRSLSRNASSSRAIPAQKLREQVLFNPVVPVQFGRTGRGMQAHGLLTPFKAWLAKKLWLFARYPAMFFHWLLSDLLGLSKQIVNRLIEPWMWSDVLLSSSEWKNFFILRCHKDAQPEFQAIANQMKELYEHNVPNILNPGEWHLPWIQETDRQLYPDIELLKQISAARCARISYLLPDTGAYSNPVRDLELCARLMEPPLHASPFEAIAVALPTSERSANFVGWRQMRSFLPNEANGDYSSCDHSK